MPLLIDTSGLGRRRDAATGELSRLAASLASELDRLVTSGPVIPGEKALLSREGGRCRRCGGYLAFDPWSPHAHHCTGCHLAHGGELHDRFRLYWYQMWLAERAVHAALLWALLGREEHRRLARAILEGYATRYLAYPNADNVLGPSRVFFSTYLESIWLLQICVALDLLEMSAGIDAPASSRVRERILEPAVALIAGYDEGMSNRQVWNNAALLAGSILLDRHGEAERRFAGGSGVRAMIEQALLPDGSWYEGENYHLFAHRGLWYGVTIAESIGLSLAPALADRFAEGFATPFLTALPDLTYPARRDSPHGVSLRQWRHAEHCELGLARTDDRRLLGALARIYADDLEPGDSGRWASSAEVERNTPAVRLDRSSLGWKALLFARPELPPLVDRPIGSVLLESQGLAVFRRNADGLYVALDYGHPGGGHGHPDRLNLLLANGSSRILDDMGTGSYVDPSLFWYRSTLAHNAPLVNGRSQRYAAGELVAYDERGGAGWALARCDGIAEGVRFDRAVVVLSGYVVERLSWRADDEVIVDLPMHVEGAPLLDGWETSELDADGAEFLTSARRTAVPEDAAVTFRPAQRDALHSVVVSGSRPFQWWIAEGPSAPGTSPRPFQILRCRAAAATFTTVWLMSPADVQLSGTDVSWSRGAERHVHRQLGDRWSIELHAGSAHSSIDLSGFIERRRGASPAGGGTRPPDPAPQDGAGRSIQLRQAVPVRMELGEPHYRRSEQPWDEVGRPSAEVEMRWSGDELEMVIDVRTPHVFFMPADAINHYDNEPPDVNGDGVQLYVGAGSETSAWMLVPDSDDGLVRVRPLAGPTGLVPDASWHRTDAGYRLKIILAIEGPAEPVDLAFDILVNLSGAGRERRQGQLVFTGATGEFVYLRGDRHDPYRRAHLTLVP
jgi:hypothetical protein